MLRGILNLRVLVAVALGAATTIGIAWGRAFTIDWWDSHAGSAYLAPRGSTTSSVTVDQRWKPGAVIRSVTASDSDDYTFVAEWSKLPLPATSAQIGVLTRDQVDDSWGAANRTLILGEARIAITEAAFGWPFPAAYWWLDHVNERSGGAAFRHNRSDEPWTQDTVILPTLPLWRGIILNTAIFSFAWWMLLFIPVLARRRIRRKRGSCPSCGYDLAGSPACAECGWNQPSPDTAPRM